jgi:hypothetical protein
MSEHRDDTTERRAPSPDGGVPEPADSYYYDDATGYEIYDPSKDEEEDEEENDKSAQGESEAGR